MRDRRTTASRRAAPRIQHKNTAPFVMNGAVFLLHKFIIPDGLQGKVTQYGGKKTGQTAFNGCEYRFLNSFLQFGERYIMNQIDWKRKLSSRKLWAAIAGIVTGMSMVFGLDESTISSVAGAVVSVASVVSYIITEGKVDAAGVKKVTDNKA